MIAEKFKRISESIEKDLSGLIRHKYFVFLLITILCGIITLLPLVSHHRYLSSGDHGRDLYCFKKVMTGALPYRDFSWVFGPLMPYYYSIFYYLFGISIQSVLLGQNFLILLAGIFIFLACATFLSLPMSFLAALAYWTFRGAGFYFTYSHTGGLVAILGSVAFLLKYIKKPDQKYVFAGYFCIFLLLLIRLNMGIAVIIVFTSFLLISDFVKKLPNFAKRKFKHIAFASVVIMLTSLIYFCLIRQIPKYAIGQCFPYLNSSRTDVAVTLSGSLQELYSFSSKNLFGTGIRRFFSLLLGLSIIQTICFFKDKNIPKNSKTDLMLALSFLLTMFVFTAHEFVMSGVTYRTCWFMPILLIIFFFLMDIATKKQSLFMAKILLIFTLLSASIIHQYNQNKTDDTYRNIEHLLTIGKTRIYSYQTPRWLNTVYKTVDYIKNNTSVDEKILVIPFDAIYYFLSEKDSGTRQLIFFEHKNITEEQEQDIIKEIEKNNVNLIVFSNRVFNTQPGMGIFGKTYCKDLGSYIFENFKVVAIFGDWTHTPGWAWNHGTKILKRKELLLKRGSTSNLLK